MQAIKKNKEIIQSIFDDPSICNYKLSSGAWTKKECFFYCDEALEIVFIQISDLEDFLTSEEEMETTYDNLEQLYYKRDLLLSLLTFCEVD